MGSYKHILGQKFNHLLVKELSHKVGSSEYYMCICVCGKERIVKKDRIIIGAVKSCGCIRKPSSNIGHGCAKAGNETPEYRTWKGIRKRCHNPKSVGYKNYGGRGIKVCDRWSKFENFLADMGQKPTPKHTIERRDNNGNYEPNNCRWATVKEQNNNRRSNTKVTYNGQTKTISQWADELGFSWKTLYMRYKRHGLRDFDKPVNFKR